MNSTTVIFLVTLVLAAAGLLLMNRIINGKSEKKLKQDKQKKNSKPSNHSNETVLSVRDLIGVTSFENNITTTTTGSVSVVIKMSTPDYNALSGDEQSAYDDALRAFCKALPYKFKLIEMVNSVDTSTVVENSIKSRKSSLFEMNTKLKCYSDQYIRALKEMEYSKNERSIDSYFIIGVKEKNLVNSIETLKKLVFQLEKNFASTEIDIYLVRREKLIELWNRMLINRSRFNVSDAISEGILDVFNF